jgi:hypothetical protein
LLLVAVISLSSSCDPVEPRPLVNAPMNRCPCEKFEPGTTAALCSEKDRCEILTAGGRPEFPFWIVVHVPESSSYAAGSTYVLSSEAAFAEPSADVATLCRPPSCLPLGGLGVASGGYQVTREESKAAGYPLSDGTSIPVRVVYEPIGDAQDATFPTLPLDALFASSRVVKRSDGSQAVEFSRALPAGRYRRVLYPQPPFDEFFPPETAERTIGTEILGDTFRLGSDRKLDDAEGDSRLAIVKRSDGLDGWRAWLVDRPSQRRISVLRTLSGTEATVRLDTTGEQRTPGGGLGDDVEAIVAPPESWTAVPRLVTRLFSGAGLKNLAYPSIPPPVAVAGVVAQPSSQAGGTLLGYPARVSFESQELTTSVDSSKLLRYSTSLNTDDRGRFATVLPPGTYVATIEPAEGTGFAKRKEVVIVDRALTALTFHPAPRTLVKGRAVLTDGRALSEADVIAVPSIQQSAQPNPLVAEPRAGLAHTAEDGRFTMELDPGPYVVSVIPKAGTGFPRVVIRTDVPAQEAELPEMRVPAPSRLAFTLQAPSVTKNVIANAVVRIFARPAVAVGGPGGTLSAADPVEIGSAMTDSTGAVEILLAQEPR